MSIDEKLERLAAMKAKGRLGGGQARIDTQHAKGKLTARERIDLLIDPGTFEELDVLAVDPALDGGEVYGDAVITGWGKMQGRMVCLFSQDFTVVGGSLGEVAASKITKIMDLAMKTGVPMIGLNDSGGARIQEGVAALGGYGEIFLRNVHASGVIPQISVNMGPSTGGAVYSPALTDFLFMIDGTSTMSLTGPDAILAATGEVTTLEELGGAAAHASKSGVAHLAFDTEQDALEEVKRLLTFLPSNHMEDPPVVDTGDPGARDIPALASIVPDDPSSPYDVRDVIELILDNGDFMELHDRFAQNVVVGFGRIEGRSIGVVANQPFVLAGVLDSDGARKAARFVRFCDAFNIPVLTLVDVPGYLPGISQEWGGIITHGAKLVYAYAEATVPKVTVILRKAVGGAYDAMGSKHLGADINYAWPTAMIVVLGGGQAIPVISRREIEAADDPEETRARLIADYAERLEHPYAAAAKGYIDDVIDPALTRRKIAQAFEVLRNKSQSMPAKKHGVIPL